MDWVAFMDKSFRFTDKIKNNTHHPLCGKDKHCMSVLWLGLLVLKKNFRKSSISTGTLK